MMKRFRLDPADRMTIIYANWWDMINTSVVIVVLTAAFGMITLHFLNILSISLIDTYIGDIQNREEVGVGLASLTISGGSASTLWILSQCITRWSTIGNFQNLSNEMLQQLRRIDLTPQENADRGEIKLRNSVQIEAFIDIALNSSELIMLLGGQTQRLMYQNIVNLRLYQQYLQNDDETAESEHAADAYNRVYACFCLIVFNLNRTPNCNQRELARIHDALFVSYFRDPKSREIYDALQRFRSYPRKRQLH